MTTLVKSVFAAALAAAFLNAPAQSTQSPKSLAEIQITTKVYTAAETDTLLSDLGFATTNDISALRGTDIPQNGLPNAPTVGERLSRILDDRIVFPDSENGSWRQKDGPLVLMETALTNSAYSAATWGDPAAGVFICWVPAPSPGRYCFMTNHPSAMPLSEAAATAEGDLSKTELDFGDYGAFEKPAAGSSIYSVYSDQMEDAVAQAKADASNSVQYVADKNGNPTAVTIGHRLTNYLVGVSAFALGTNTAASGTCSIAMGYRAYATNDYSFVWYGNSSSRRLYTSHGDGTFNLNPVGGLGGVYIGATSLADTLAGLLPVSFTNQANVALGSGAEAKEYSSGGPSVAIGNGAKAPKSSTAVGAGAKIDGAYGTAVGRDADASSGSTALGDKSKATGHNSSALGRNAQATNDYSVALGGGAWSFGVYSTAAGEGARAYGNYSTAVGGHSYYPEYSWEDTGPGARAYGTYSTALGSGAAAEGNSSTALGAGATASGTYSTALGNDAKASALGSTALGYVAKASGPSSTALGYNAEASGTYSTALGTSAKASGGNSIALGFLAQATHTNSVVLNATGNYRYSQGDGTITLAVKNGLADVYVGNLTLTDAIAALLSSPDASNALLSAVSAVAARAAAGPSEALAGWTPAEYASAVSRYEWDAANSVCYRRSAADDYIVLKAVTNIDLTAAANVAALRAIERSLEAALPPVVTGGYTAGYETKDWIVADSAHAADFVLEGDRLENASVTLLYSSTAGGASSPQPVSETVPPGSVSSTARTATIASAALEGVRANSDGKVVFRVSTPGGQTTSPEATVADPTAE